MEASSSSNNSSGSPSAEFAALWNSAMKGEGLDQWTTFYVEKPVQLDHKSPAKPTKIIQRHEVGMSVVNPRSRIVRKPRGVVYSDEESDTSPQKKSVVIQQAVERNAPATVSGANKNGIKKDGKQKSMSGHEVSTSKEAAKKKLGIFASKRDMLGRQPVEPRYDLRTRTSTNKSEKSGIRRRTVQW